MLNGSPGRSVRAVPESRTAATATPIPCPIALLENDRGAFGPRFAVGQGTCPPERSRLSDKVRQKTPKWKQKTGPAARHPALRLLVALGPLFRNTRAKVRPTIPGSWFV